MKYGIPYKGHEKEYKRLQSVDRLYQNRLKNTLATAKSRAKKRGLEFDLEIDDLKFPMTCPIMGIPIFYTKGTRTDNSPSLDRVDNAKGYTKDNVQIISWLANGRKGDLSVEQIDRMYEYVHGRNHN